MSKSVKHHREGGVSARSSSFTSSSTSASSSSLTPSSTKISASGSNDTLRETSSLSTSPVATSPASHPSRGPGPFFSSYRVKAEDASRRDNGSQGTTPPPTPASPNSVAQNTKERKVVGQVLRSKLAENASPEMNGEEGAVSGRKQMTWSFARLTRADNFISMLEGLVGSDPREDFAFLKKIQSPTGRVGSSGVGYKAEHLKSHKIVHIKCMGIDTSSALCSEVCAKVMYIKTLSHPHLVSYYGTLPYGADNLWVVTDYCAYGSVYEVLKMGVEGRRQSKKSSGRLGCEAKVSGVDNDDGRTREEGKDGVEEEGKDCSLGESPSSASVDHLLSQGREYVRPSELQIAAILKPMVQALAYLHKYNCLHRDVNCRRFLLDGASLKLGGLRLCSQQVDTSRTTSVVQKPTHAAPEVLMNEGTVTVAADVWSLGVSAIELVEGAAPHARERMIVVMEKVCRYGKETQILKSEEKNHIFSDALAVLLQ